jgi:hypothetical protein
MILPYYSRLLCLCLATFFVVHALSWLAVRGVAPTMVRIAKTMRPRQASRLLFAARVLPAGATIFLIVGFCIPSYLWLEPDLVGERVGWLCLGAALLGGAAWTVALLRGASALLLTSRYVRRCRADAVSCNAEELLVVKGASTIIAVAGVVHPRLVVSQAVLDALSTEQREVAFRHEAAHRASGDNLKRLIFLLTPDMAPFIGRLSCLEKPWATFTEWAADDDAVDGDRERALSLAFALVRVAKLGIGPAPAYLLSTLMDDHRDLATRVDRLLCEPAYAEKPLQPLVAFARNAALVASGVSLTLMLWPESLGSIHRLLEQLVQ